MADNSKELLRVFIDQAPVAIAMFDRQMRYVAASRRWLTDYGLRGGSLRGLSHYDLFPEIPDRWRTAHQRGLEGEVVSCDEDYFESAPGKAHWLRWEIRPWYSGNDPGGITIFAEDITERKRAEEGERTQHREEQERIMKLNVDLEQHVRERTAQLEESVASLRSALAEAERLRKELHEQAIRDPLTDLFNRRFLEETLAREIARAGRAHSQLSLIMFDMDNFKRLNDSFGHAVGDAVLRAVGQLVVGQVRAQDVVCRYGGDEFVVVLPDTTLDLAGRKANQMLWRLRQLGPKLVVKDFEVRFSMGIAAFPQHGESCVQLLAAVDAALYRAKQLGGGTVIAAA
jgi:diguanylate cyclase (GGDEF)-like protein/PAS domain S-box-containing protein